MSEKLSNEMSDILTQVAKEFETADVYNQWMPPDGTYTTLLTAYADGVSVKGTNKVAWWKLTGRIVDPSNAELNEKEFTVGFYSTRQVGILKGAMAVLAGRKIDDIRQAEPILHGAVGWVVNVKVRTTEAKDGSGTEYHNANIVGVVQKS